MKKLLLILCSGFFYVVYADTDNKWNLHSELSYVKTSGNSDIETAQVKIEAKKEVLPNRFNIKSEFLYGKSDGKENSNKFYGLGRWERLITEKLFWFLQGDYLRDRFSGFDYRTNWSLGFGYDVIKNKKVYLKLLTSLGYTFEDLKKEGSNDYTSGDINLSLNWNIRENLVFKNEIDYLQSFKEYSVYYVNINNSLEVKINQHLSLGVGYNISYQHKPPSSSYKKIDTNFLTSLVIDY